MSRNPFHCNSSFLVTMVAVVSMFALDGFGQTIDTPVITGSPVCAGSNVSVSFVVTNGNGKENDVGNGVGGGAEKFFTTSTLYTLELYSNNSLITTATVTDTSSTAPAAEGGASAMIVKDFLIPSNMNGGQYQVKITSENPSPTGNNADLMSALFDVHAVISNNNIYGGQSGCNPYTSQPLTGSQPTGGNSTYTYLWESSTAGPSSGFLPAAGTNDDQQYEPGTLTQTTWFRRVVISGACTSDSNVIEISITNDNTWTGDIDTDWNTAGNWSCNAVPIPVTNVIIPSTLPSNNYPILNTGVPGTANDITIEAGASITINNNVLELGGSISNFGSLDAENGGLAFVGSSAQTLPADCLVNNRLTNLTVNNSAGLTLNGPVEVTGIVLAETGDLIANGYLKLISDPIQTALISGSGTGEILGNVVMQRYLDVAYGYKYFSTPFHNTTVGDFSLFMDLKDPATNFPHFYGYDESRKSNGEDASGWVIDTLETSNLEIGRGYAVNFGSNSTSKLVELSGQVNNGQVDLILSNNAGLYTQGYHLLGNPYPSPIDWTQVNRNNMEDAIYFFTASATDQYTGVYTSVVGGVSNDGNTSEVIPSMQGFFVKVADGATAGSITFQNSGRINDFSQLFHKKPKSNSGNDLLVRLQAGFKSSKKDALVIYFPQGGRYGFEEDKDAQKIYNTDPNVPSFYSIIKRDQKLSINALPLSEEKIPLGIKVERPGKMSISLQDVHNLSSGIVLYLQDMESGRMINLSEEQSYSFEVKKGEHNDRFFLVLSTEKLSAAEMGLAVEPFSVSSKKGEIIVQLNLPESELNHIKLFNISGQLLQKKTGEGKEEITFTGITGSGIYILTLEGDTYRFTKKILHKI